MLGEMRWDIWTRWRWKKWEKMTTIIRQLFFQLFLFSPIYSTPHTPPTLTSPPTTNHRYSHTCSYAAVPKFPTAISFTTKT